MNVNIRQDHVEIEGYVNAVERNSRPLRSRMGKFIERICKGAFKNAIKRNDDIHILLNHDWNRDLGSTKQGNLELEEDNIGLKARAKITDKEIIEKARRGDLVGWSFGFSDVDVENTTEHDMPVRAVKEMDLYEVSILDRAAKPAYDGNLITARSENNEVQFRSEPFIDKVVIKELREEKTSDKPVEPPVEEKTEQLKKAAQIDYSKYENIIKEMKGF